MGTGTHTTIERIASMPYRGKGYLELYQACSKRWSTWASEDGGFLSDAAKVIHEAMRADTHGSFVQSGFNFNKKRLHPEVPTKEKPNKGRLLPGMSEDGGTHPTLKKYDLSGLSANDLGVGFMDSVVNSGPATYAGKPAYIFGRGSIAGSNAETSAYDIATGVGLGGLSNAEVQDHLSMFDNKGSSTLAKNIPPAVYTGTGWLSDKEGRDVKVVLHDVHRNNSSGHSCFPISPILVGPDFVWYVITHEGVMIKRGPMAVRSPELFPSVLMGSKDDVVSNHDIEYLYGSIVGGSIPEKDLASTGVQSEAESFLKEVKPGVILTIGDSMISAVQDGSLVLKSGNNPVSTIDRADALDKISVAMANGSNIHFGLPVRDSVLSAYDAYSDDKHAAHKTGKLHLLSADKVRELAYGIVSDKDAGSVFRDTTKLMEGIRGLFAGKSVCVFDLETTGLSPMSAQVNQIAASFISGDDLLSGASQAQDTIDLRAKLSQYTKNRIKGPNDPAIRALRKQGIKVDADAAGNLVNIPESISDDLPSELEVIKQFEKKCQEKNVSLFLAHNAKFDTTMLYHRGFEYGSTPVLDTVKLIDVVLVPCLKALKKDWSEGILSKMRDVRIDHADRIRPSKGRGFSSKLGIVADAMGTAAEGYHDAAIDVGVTLTTLASMLKLLDRFVDEVKSNPDLAEMAASTSKNRIKAQAMMHGVLEVSESNGRKGFLLKRSYSDFVKDAMLDSASSIEKAWSTLSSDIVSSGGNRNTLKVPPGIADVSSTEVSKLISDLRSKNAAVYMTSSSPRNLLAFISGNDGLQPSLEHMLNWVKPIISGYRDTPHAADAHLRHSLIVFRKAVEESSGRLNDILNGVGTFPPLSEIAKDFEEVLR